MVLACDTSSCHDDHLCQIIFKSHHVWLNYGTDTILEYTNTLTHTHTDKVNSICTSAILWRRHNKISCTYLCLYYCFGVSIIPSVNHVYFNYVTAQHYVCEWYLMIMQKDQFRCLVNWTQKYICCGSSFPWSSISILQRNI